MRPYPAHRRSQQFQILTVPLGEAKLMSVRESHHFIQASSLNKQSSLRKWYKTLKGRSAGFMDFCAVYKGRMHRAWRIVLSIPMSFAILLVLMIIWYAISKCSLWLNVPCFCLLFARFSTYNALMNSNEFLQDDVSYCWLCFTFCKLITVNWYCNSSLLWRKRVPLYPYEPESIES